MKYSFVVGAASLALVYAAPAYVDNSNSWEKSGSAGYHKNVGGPDSYGQGSVYGHGQGGVAVSPVSGGAGAGAGAGGSFGAGANVGAGAGLGGGVKGGKSTLLHSSNLEWTTRYSRLFGLGCLAHH